MSEDPYNAPKSAPLTPSSTGDDDIRKKFNQQSLALGFLWLLIGGLGALGVSVAGEQIRAENQILFYVLLTLMVVWVCIGALTMMRKIPAIIVGLVLSYISLAGQIFQIVTTGKIPFLALLLLAAAILQAHRLLSFSKKLR